VLFQSTDFDVDEQLRSDLRTLWGIRCRKISNVDWSVDQRPTETFLSAFQGQILRAVVIEMTASYKGERWGD
jgi:hypothetical protein